MNNFRSTADVSLSSSEFQTRLELDVSFGETKFGISSSGNFSELDLDEDERRQESFENPFKIIWKEILSRVLYQDLSRRLSRAEDPSKPFILQPWVRILSITLRYTFSINIVEIHTTYISYWIVKRTKINSKRPEWVHF